MPSSIYVLIIAHRRQKVKSYIHSRGLFFGLVFGIIFSTIKDYQRKKTLEAVPIKNKNYIFVCMGK